LGLFSIAVVINRFAFRRVLDYAAKTYEILFMTAIATCFFFIGLSYALGFSIAIGAFIGGLALASFPYNLEIEGEIHSLRDFFSVIFFATLGMQLNVNVIFGMFNEFCILLLLIILVKPLILGIIYLFLGYGGRTASIVGLGLGQASEFSFIIAAQGLVLNHISANEYSLIVSVVVVSMVVTPYLMMFRGRIYNMFTRARISALRNYIHPRKLYSMEKNPKRNLENHIVVFGADRMGRKIIEYLKNKKKNFVVVEHNPEIVKKLNSQNINCIYGDAENEDILRRVGIYRAKLIILTIPDSETACFVVTRVNRFNPKGIIFARAHSTAEAEDLYRCGAKFVVIPEFVSSEKIIRRIEHLIKRKTSK